MDKIFNHQTASLSEIDLKMIKSVPSGGNWKNIPKSIPSKAAYPKFKDEVCHGLRIEVEDKNTIIPFDMAVNILNEVYKLHPDDFEFLSSNFIDKLYGSDKLRLSIENNQDVSLLIESWNNMKNKDGYFIY